MVMKFNGKPFRPGDLERAINKAAKELVVKHVRDTVGPLRDPDTDQFVTVAVDGSDLHSLAISGEGSAQVMERVRENLELQPNISAESEAGDAVMAEPHVFLSFGWEDHALAERIATQLIEAGVQTWWSSGRFARETACVARLMRELAAVLILSCFSRRRRSPVLGFKKKLMPLLQEKWGKGSASYLFGTTLT